MLLRLALLNLTRNKRRSVLATAAIVVGVFYLIAGRSFVGGMNEGIYFSTIHGLVGHITLRPADYPEIPLSNPIDDLVEIGPEARAAIEEVATAWTTRILFSGTVVSGQDTLRVRGIGYEADRDASVFRRDLWKVDGKIPQVAADGVLVSSALAPLLRVKVGDHVVLKARTHLGAINALDLAVAGIVDTGNMALNNNTILMSMDLARDLVRADQPSHVSLLIGDRDDAPAVGAALAARVPGSEAINWLGESEDMMRIQAVRMMALNVLVSLLMVMSSMAIANTILMAAHERVREIGTLRAMGMSRRGVLVLFLLEGGLMGAVAGTVGALLGGGLAYRLHEHPFDFSQMTRNMTADMPFSLYIYGRFDLPLVLWPVVISLLVALVASIYPAFSASKLEPADAVRAS